MNQILFQFPRSTIHHLQHLLFSKPIREFKNQNRWLFPFKPSKPSHTLDIVLPLPLNSRWTLLHWFFVSEFTLIRHCWWLKHQTQQTLWDFEQRETHDCRWWWMSRVRTTLSYSSYLIFSLPLYPNTWTLELNSEIWGWNSKQTSILFLYSFENRAILLQIEVMAYLVNPYILPRPFVHIFFSFL